MAKRRTQPSLAGWDITHVEDAEWAPWGEGGKARAKVLGTADGYLVMLVEAQAGYEGAPHQHEQVLTTGDGYAAAGGSTHDDFEALAPSTYLVIFRL
jgi:hypothetical protein